MPEIHPEKQAEIDRNHYQEAVIKEVTPHDDSSGWSVLTESGWGFGIQGKWGQEPHVGQTIRTFTHQGSIIHGIDLDGVELFYHDKARQEQDAEQRKADHDARLKADFERDHEQIDADWLELPEVYRERVERFRQNNPDFRWQFESYELFSCKEAHKFADIVRQKMADDGIDADEAIGWWQGLDYTEQEALGMSEGHSGNTFGAACRFAYWEVTEPLTLLRDHGALATLVGCDEYGCHTQDDFADATA